MDAYCERVIPDRPMGGLAPGDTHGPRIGRHTRTGTAGRVRGHRERTLHTVPNGRTLTLDIIPIMIFLVGVF